MRPLLESPVQELDPETAAIVDEVCTALEWFSPEVPGSHEPAQAHQLGPKWGVAYESTGDHGLRRLIFDCCDAIVRNDPDLVITIQGHIFTRDQIAQYHGRLSSVVDSQTGEYRQTLEWPSGTYASGAPSYEREGRAA